MGPAPIAIPVGTTAVWTNADAVPHTVTADDGSFGSDLLDQGQSIAHRFDRPGTDAYGCDIHPEMDGTIVVGGA